MASREAAINVALSTATGAHETIERNARAQLRVLPPAANWYCAQVCDWGYDARNARWLIVYGAKNGICIYEFAVEAPSPTAHATAPTSADPLDHALHRPLRTNFVALLARGKKDGRVTALRCVHDVNGDLRVVCAGEEGAVQLWDPVSLVRVDQHRKHNTTEVTAVGVRSALDPNWIVAGDRQGVLSLWQRDSGLVHTFTPQPRDAVFAMDVSPFDKTVVAVGYRSGALCIVNVVEKSVRYRLDGHELEVQSVVWSSTFTASGSSVDYLATASRDRSIKVWAFPRKQTAGHDDEAPSLSARLEIRKPQQASSHSQSNRLWLPLAWTYDLADGCKYGLWTGSFEGNLQLYQWNGPPSGTVKPSLVVKNGHNRLLFGIASLRASNSVPPSAEPSHARFPSLMATISLDRDLRVWTEDLKARDAGRMSCIERIPAQGGFAYSLDFNPTRNVLACGVGDQTIRLWALSAKQSAGGYQSELVWKGLQSKVTVVRWHPMQDHVLAFGTEDGRVGLWDSRNKSAKRLKVNQLGEVADLQWTVQAQPATESDSMSSFQEAMMALEQAQADGQTLEDAMVQQQQQGSQPSSGDVTVFLWSCDRSGLLCRTDVDKDASILIRRDCCSFTWDSASSALAVGLCSGRVEVLVRSNAAVASKEDHGLATHLSVFEHKENVSALSWSSPDAAGGTLLASATRGGEIIVHEGVLPCSSVRRYKQLPGYGESVVVMFKAHAGGVNCLRWSPSAEKCMLASCGDDGVVNVWNVADRALQSLFRLHTNRVFSVCWITSTVLASCGQDQSIRLWNFEDHAPNADGDESLQGTNSRPTPVKKVPSVARSTQIDEPAPATTKPNSKSRGKKKTEHGQSIFTRNDAAWMLGASPNTGGPSNTSTTDTRDGLDVERSLLEQDGKIDEVAQLYLLEGRITDALRLVANHGLLSPTWVSYAPMAGQEVWREVSLLYAAQHKKGGDFKSAALQFLAVSHVESAVECFVAGDMYPEAISLILTRLGVSHPLLKSAQWKYAEQLEKKKKTDEAASVYLVIGSSEAHIRAITILGTSGSIEQAKRAMAVSNRLCEVSTTDTTIGENRGAVLLLPTTVFVSICRLALTHNEFQLASQAISGLLRNVTPGDSLISSGSTILYMLSLITIGFVEVLDSAETQGDSTYPVMPEPTHKTYQEARQFIESLNVSLKLCWKTLLDYGASDRDVSSGSNGVWSKLLSVCRNNGLWFEDSTLVPDEVVEQLGDATAFDYMLPESSDDKSTKLRELIHSSRLIMKLLTELMCGYLLSALEVLRDLLLTLTVSRNDQVPILRLLFPGGLLDPASPPLFGELADEETDTKALWAECCLLQSELAIRHCREQSVSNDRADTSFIQLSSYLTDIIQLPATSEAIASRAHVLRDEIAQVSRRAPLSSQETTTTEANGDITTISISQDQQ